MNAIDDVEDPEYGWLCPVCREVLDSETCPKCPRVVLLKMKKTWNPRLEAYYWRRLS